MNIPSVSRALALSGMLIAIPAVAGEPVSGYEFLTPEMQAMQDDDFANPGMITVDAGESLFFRQGANGKSCATCHSEDSKLDPERIARYPVYNEESGKPVTLRARILTCRNKRMDGPTLAYGDADALRLETYVRRLAHGERINVDVSGGMQPFYRAGEKLFHMRWGQVDVACHQCHLYHAGQTFRGQNLSQGQVNGFPVYRFTEGQMAGLQERITQCLTSLRAEPYKLGSEEYNALEVYMTARSNGLKIETPGIRY